MSSSMMLGLKNWTISVKQWSIDMDRYTPLDIDLGRLIDYLWIIPLLGYIIYVKCYKHKDAPRHIVVKLKCQMYSKCSSTAD